MSQFTKEIMKLLKMVETSSGSVLEEFQNDPQENAYLDEVEYTGEPAVMPEHYDDEEYEEEGDDFPMANLTDEDVLNIYTNVENIEQKKILLIDYFDKLIDKSKLVRDHIDNLSFDIAIVDRTSISISELQFRLEELRSKIIKYIEDQFKTDKYERSLYTYLSFMEELKMIVKLLNKQINKKK